MCARAAKADDALPPAEPDPGRVRRWLREHLVLPAVLYCALLVSLYWLMTGCSAWTPVARITGRISRCSAPFPHDGSRVVTMSTSAAHVHDLDACAPPRRLGHGNAGIDDAAYMANSGKILTVHVGRGACIWDAETGTLLHVLQGAGPGFWGAAPFPDDGLVATVTSGCVEVWDVRGPEPLVAMRKPSDVGRTVAVSPDGRLLAVGTREGCVEVRDARTGRRLRLLDVQNEDRAPRVAFAPGGSAFAVACAGGVAKVYDASRMNRPVVRPEANERPVVLSGRPLLAARACWSPDGGRVVTACGSCARVWDARTGACLAELPHPGRRGVRSAAFAPRGGRILTAASDDRSGSIRVWDAASFTLLAVVDAPEASRAAFSPDGRFMVGDSWRGFESRVWRRRRPERWWGVLWLKELWIALALACAFGLALWRDLRRQRSTRDVG